MKNIIKLFFIIFLPLVFLTKAYPADEKMDLLKIDWSFKDFLESLIEDHYKEVTRSIPKFALHVIQ